MVDAIGHITGCHLNPAVSIGLVTSDRFPANQLIPYIIAQVLGAIPAAGVLYLIARGSGYEGGLTPNGFAAHSLGGYSMSAALVCKIVMTFIFLMIFLGATNKRAPV